MAGDIEFIALIMASFQTMMFADVPSVSLDTHDGMKSSV